MRKPWMTLVVLLGDEKVTVDLEINSRELQHLARRACFNKSGRSVDGPVVAHVVDRASCRRLVEALKGAK